MTHAAGSMDAEPMTVVNASTATATAAVENGDTNVEGSGNGGTIGWQEYLIFSIIALVIAIVVAIGSWYFVGRQQVTKIGVVDLPQLMEIEELSLTLSMMNRGVTDDDRAAAFMRVRSFGEKLEKAVEQARVECGCLLITKNAYIGDSKLDQTARVKAILGYEGANVQELRNKVKSNVQGLADPTQSKK